MFFSQGSVEVKAGDELNVALVIDALGIGVSGAEIQLKFDTDALELLSALPGTFLGPDPLVIVLRVDNESGDAQIAVVRKGGTEVPTATGELLNLRWRIRPEAEPGFYSAGITTARLTDENAEFIANIGTFPVLFIVK